VAVARVLEARFPQITLNTSATLRERTQDMQTLYTVLNTLIGLTLVVGGVVMTNAMLMSVFERTQEIGVLRALGWSRARVVGLVLTEALVLSALSALVGGGLGVGLSYALTLAPFVGEYLAPAYTPQMLVQVAALTLGLGAAGGLYPAWRAASLRPIEALRYE
jgi:ABC-type antimicrobial peptide transport system permease subunit